MNRWLLVTLLASASSPAWPANGNIGIFFDPDATVCDQVLPCQGSTTLYVYALLQGASGEGITSAEYKVREGADNGADPAYFFLEMFDPHATVSGSGAFTPVDPATRGVVVAWGDCQRGDGTKILLETVIVYNSGCSTDEFLLTVVKHDNPSRWFFQCPQFTLCDAPTYTSVCLGSNVRHCFPPEPPFLITMCSTSGQAYLNPGPNRHCTVAVQPSAWGDVKELYRH